MAEVRHDTAFLGVVDQLTESKEELDNRGVFRTYKDVIKFAAMVGYRFHRRRPVETIGREIPQRIFENSNDNDLVYLLALIETQRVDVLQDEETEAYQIFEEYANGGLELIQQWLEEQPSDTTGVRTLLGKIYEELGSDAEEFRSDIQF